MRIIQIITKGAPYFSAKSQRSDRLALEGRHQIETWSWDGSSLRNEAGTTVESHQKSFEGAMTHIYGASGMASWMRRIRPLVVDENPPARMLDRLLRTTLISSAAVREAVDPDYAEVLVPRPAPRPPWLIGSLIGTRPGVRDVVSLTMARLARFRDDLEWLMWEDRPDPMELHEIHLWVDPCTQEGDRDGMVAEALAAGCPVLACRTPWNESRLAGGLGRLTKPRDPNELTHAIATTLFRDPIPQADREEIRERFSPQSRAHELEVLYGKVAFDARPS